MILINTYLVIINLISFLLMKIDKLLAIKNKRRISERTLITISIIGGTLGTTLGMVVFRHKIRKTKFILLFPLTIIYTVNYIYQLYM